MSAKTYDEVVKEIKEDLQKLSNTEIGLQDAINLFENNIKKIKVLKKELEGYQMKVQKVLADNKLEDFEA